MAHLQHINNFAEQLAIHILDKCFENLTGKVENDREKICNIQKTKSIIKISPKIDVNRIIALRESGEEYAEYISKIIIKNVLRELCFAFNSCNGKEKHSVDYTENGFSVEIARAGCDIKVPVSSRSNCASLGSLEKVNCLVLENTQQQIDMITNIPILICHSNSNNSTVTTNRRLNVTDLSSSSPIILHHYCEELSSLIIRASMDSISYTFKTGMEMEMKLWIDENRGRKPKIEDVIQNGLQNAKALQPLSVSTIPDNIIQWDRVVGNETVSLYDTFLFDLFSQTCDQSCNSSEVKVKKFLNSSRTKSKKLSKLEKKKKKWLKKLSPIEIPEFNEMGFKVKLDSTDDGIYKSETSSMYCPVCLDIYYRPYNCMPCTHTFCEPCLRRLSKYNVDKKVSHSCPICRVLISYCEENKALGLEMQSWCPDDYHRRQVTDGSNKYMNFPLPSKPTKVSLKNIANIIRESNRSRQQQRESQFKRFCNSISSLDFWKLLLLLVLKCILMAVMIWFCNILSNEGNLNMYVNEYRNRLWNYSELSVQEQAKVTNDFVVLCSGICGIMIIAGYVSKRLIQVNGR